MRTSKKWYLSITWKTWCKGSIHQTSNATNHLY